MSGREKIRKRQKETKIHPSIDCFFWPQSSWSEVVRPSPLSRLHNWWCDIRHNCHKNHRGRGASLSSQRGGKIVFKDFFSRPPEEGGSLSSRNFSSLIFNGKRILQGVLITLKIFYPVEVSLIAKNLHTTIQSWKLTRRSRAWYNYSSFRFPVCSKLTK